MLCTLGWGCVGSARKTAKPTVLGRDTHHSRAQCRTGLSMEAAAGAAAQAPAPQCVVCGAPTTTDDAAQHTCGGDKGRASGVSNHLGAVRCTLSRLSETSGRRDTLMRAHASLPATDFSTVRLVSSSGSRLGEVSSPPAIFALQLLLHLALCAM